MVRPWKIKAAADFSNLPSPQTALYNLGARPGRNLLDNHNFAIWQRYPNGEFTGVPNGTYIADRFTITSSNGSIQSKLARIDGGGIKNLSGPNCVVCQRIENAAQYNGMTLTRSFLYELNGNQRLESYTSVAADWTDATDVLRDGPRQAWIAEGETLLAAKLELGLVQTLTHRDASGNWVLNDPSPDPALELLKCQRYQQCAGFTRVAFGPIIDGHTVSSSIQIGKMRENPTCKLGLLDIPYQEQIAFDPAKMIFICVDQHNISVDIVDMEIANRVAGKTVTIVGFFADANL